ncbi:hypothetical protein SA22_3807 [Salmonella enterica subsp. enterica serovar Agona str. 22.H.04]|uniref:Uncharacterized protein n=14 Tax=Salmonella enterica I TaxID=59201 RepID=A0A0N1QVM2_SALSV|nr:hypothetical protein SPAB_02664 [Salmonella enterica subsp. enterica serovar Paratyphi B str. SPB7]ACF61706.1 hypothetical protein SNSL254_A0901 [Salmonella enterica subsp. enterica serovar Newport str. SL254]ACF69513.1 hypothetical protein SeHA_C0964 [Salmonella enterica subsp. enterica serovar Heidelberg str. SL476]ACF90306.1 hypothetical protein SeSA_A0985 [Salmonella enterica subsp. enterica serovar Schwarzengrund str. CVM19633]ACH49469.1 hypothetical protein SeAg_B0873 [Salmonella enter
MPLLQKRHVLTLARRVITCLIMRKKGIGFATASRKIFRAARR